MIDITFTYESKDKAMSVMNTLRQSLVGWKPFIDNEVIISPVRKDINKDYWEFNLTMGDNKSNTLTSGIVKEMLVSKDTFKCINK